MEKRLYIKPELIGFAQPDSQIISLQLSIRDAISQLPVDPSQSTLKRYRQIAELCEQNIPKKASNLIKNALRSEDRRVKAAGYYCFIMAYMGTILDALQPYLNQGDEQSQDDLLQEVITKLLEDPILPQRKLTSKKIFTITQKIANQILGQKEPDSIENIQLAQPNTTNPNPEQYVLAQELRNTLLKTLYRLYPNPNFPAYRMAVYRYGIYDPRLPGMPKGYGDKTHTVAEVAEAFGVEEQRVKQAIANFLSKLRANPNQNSLRNQL